MDFRLFNKLTSLHISSLRFSEREILPSRLSSPMSFLPTLSSPGFTLQCRLHKQYINKKNISLHEKPTRRGNNAVYILQTRFCILIHLLFEKTLSDWWTLFWRSSDRRSSSKKKSVEHLFNRTDWKIVGMWRVRLAVSPHFKSLY